MSLMHPTRIGAEVMIWMVDDVPARLVHEGIRYRVTDTPTRLEDDEPELTYRLNLTGWRFQGTDDAGLSHMFDVRRAGPEWRLMRVYD